MRKISQRCIMHRGDISKGIEQNVLHTFGRVLMTIVVKINGINEEENNLVEAY